jgi:hypothetical protein
MCQIRSKAALFAALASGFFILRLKTYARATSSLTIYNNSVKLVRNAERPDNFSARCRLKARGNGAPEIFWHKICY